VEDKHDSNEENADKEEKVSSDSDEDPRLN
jgi:hypothetical protein